MLTLTAEQEAILRLPDPYAFVPALAAEIRRDDPSAVADLDDRALVNATDQSYTHASEVLRITFLPTLVAWVKADVAWARGLRNELSVDLRVRTASKPSLAAQDVLTGLRAGGNWTRGGRHGGTGT